MNNSITKLASIAFSGSIVGHGFRYLFLLVIAQGINAEALGLFAFGMVVMKAGGVFARAGLDSAAKKYIPIFTSRDDQASLVGTVLICLFIPFVLGMGVVAIVFALYMFAGTGLPEFDATTRLFIFGIPLFASMTVGMAATRGFKESKYAVYIRDFGQSGLGLILISYAAFGVGDVGAVVVAYLVSLLAGVGLSVYYLVHLGGVSLSTAPNFKTRSIFSFAMPLLAVATTQYLMSWTDILLLGVLVPPSEVGYYQAAFQTSALLLVVLRSFNSIFPSVAADLYNNGKMEMLQLTYTGVTKWASILTITGGVFLVVFNKQVLSLFGSDFGAAQSVLFILVVGQMVAVLAGPTSSLLAMVGQERLELVNTVAVTVLNVALNLALIREFGILGAAIATSFSMALINIIQVVEIQWLVGLQPYGRSYARGLVPCAMSVGTILVGSQVAPASLVGAIMTGTLALGVLAVVQLLLGFDETDRRLLKSVN